VGILDLADVSRALAMVDDRNITVHTYNEVVAAAIFGRLPGHAELIGKVLAAVEVRLHAYPSP
jgi:uncharacterized protein YutE (UPF0331/DUF86 family)